jgi:PEP-CTERM motif
MKSTRILRMSALVLSAASLLAFAPAAKATTFPDLVYTVTLNLNSLQGSLSDPLSLDLQLTTGSGNVSNTVTLSNFVFTGGTASATPDFTNGGESGSFASSVILTNSAGDNEFAAALSSGVTQISFKVDETRNNDVVGTGTATPDQFNVAVLDNNLINVPTTDPTGNNNLVTSVLVTTETAATVKQYAVVATPEPSTYALMLGGLLTLGALLRRRARNA